LADEGIGTKDERRKTDAFKFEKLEVWQLALDYIDLIYEIAGQLPRSEEYNLLSFAIRSLLETVACQHIINRRKFVQDVNSLRQAYRQAETLVAKLHTMRKAIAPERPWLREEPAEYGTNDEGRMTTKDE